MEILEGEVCQGKKKPASGAAGGKKKIWCHMQSLHFLNDVITSNYK